MSARAAAQHLRAAALRALQLQDRARLAWLHALHSGLQVHSRAATAFAAARFNLAPGARLRIAAGAATERISAALAFVIHPGGEVVVEPGAWLRTEAGPVVITAWPGARIVVGAGALLNGCSLSAKQSVAIGPRAVIGIGSRIYDADQHDFDAARPEQCAPVQIGAHAWLASDVTVLRGVHIGEHSVIGARSLVQRNIPPHTFAAGAPALPKGQVGDRSAAR